MVEVAAIDSWAKPVAYLAADVEPGQLVISLDREIGAAEGLRLGDPGERSYECIGVDPGQVFPASAVRLWTPPRMRYAIGEPVGVVKDWR